MKPTPYFTFESAKIAHNYKAFTSALPGVSVRYALKSSPLIDIAATLSDLGSGFEIASKAELAKLLSIDVDVSKIIFSNPVKKAEDIRYAYRKGISIFACDSLEEVQKLAENAPGCSVLIRVKVYERGSVFSLKDKFGIEEGAVPRLVREITAANLKFEGLSFHVGSQSLKLNTWKYALEKILRIQSALRDRQIEINTLNLGGGFPWLYRGTKAPSIIEIAEVIKPYLDKLKVNHILAEPGRYLVASSATLTTSIIHITKRDGKTWLYLDAGTYNALFEAMSFQGETNYKVSAIGGHEKKSRIYTLAGPTCDSIDTITKNAHLPADLEVGDRLVFSDVGAYSYGLSSGFNGFATPKIYFE
ncbi:type III PLP-dependent enzyme [bacterium]|nr:type III PLP-dependent enzyme [bacterium]